LLKKQIEFVKSDSREVLYSGAFGAGKTRSVCMKAVMRASKPGACEALVRKHLVSLKATTLKTLLEPEGNLPPVLPEGTYTHNKSDKTIRIHGGGQIVYFGLDDPGKIGSYTLSGIGIDEASETTEADYTMLRGRSRMSLDGLPNQIYGATNPSHQKHHLAVRFGLDGEHKAAPGCYPILTCSADNYFLPAPYLADLNTYTGLSRRRYVLGEWCSSEGLIYDAFDPSIFVRERVANWSRVIVGGDWGFTNPSVLLLVCEDEDGYLHVSEEFYQTQQLEPDIVKQCERFKNYSGASEFVIDPSAAALRATMEREALNVIAGNNDVLGGIARVQKRFVMLDDRPRITISPTCTNLLRELGMYEWTPGGKDRPKKENDHALDALRYAVMHIDDCPEIEIRVMHSGQSLSRAFKGKNHNWNRPGVWTDLCN
jgi:PBSX family phage terminase large subunit